MWALTLLTVLCELSRDYVARFAKCATAVMRKARVEHLDSFDVATAAKNTVLHGGKLTWSAVWKSNLSIAQNEFHAG